MYFCTISLTPVTERFEMFEIVSWAAVVLVQNDAAHCEKSILLKVLPSQKIEILYSFCMRYHIQN